VSIQLPVATPHLIGLFFVQLPSILSENQLIENDFRLYPVSRETLLKHFVFSMSNWNAQRYHTLFTSTLVHQDFGHWWLNFFPLAIKAIHLIPNIGGPMFWLTYFSGGLAGNLAVVWKHYYHMLKLYILNIIS